MNYFEVRKVHQCLQNLDRESSDQVQTESSEICLLQELVKIFVQKFKCYTSMASEMERVFHSYKVALELRVMKQGSFQDFNLNFCLGGKLLLGLDNFKGDVLFFLMIEGFKHFSERTPADIFDDLIFVSNGVTNEGFGLALRVGKIGRVVNSSFAEVKDFELGDLIFFKGSDFFLAVRSFGVGSVVSLGGVVFFGGVFKEGDFALVKFVAKTDDIFVGVFSVSLVFRKDFPEGRLVGAGQEVIFEEPLVVFIC